MQKARFGQVKPLPRAKEQVKQCNQGLNPGLPDPTACLLPTVLRKLLPRKEKEVLSHLWDGWGVVLTQGSKRFEVVHSLKNHYTFYIPHLTKGKFLEYKI